MKTEQDEFLNLQATKIKKLSPAPKQSAGAGGFLFSYLSTESSTKKANNKA